LQACKCAALLQGPCDTSNQASLQHQPGTYLSIRTGQHSFQVHTQGTKSTLTDTTAKTSCVCCTQGQRTESRKDQRAQVGAQVLAPRAALALVPRQEVAQLTVVVALAMHMPWSRARQCACNAVQRNTVRHSERQCSSMRCKTMQSSDEDTSMLASAESRPSCAPGRRQRRHQHRPQRHDKR